MKLAAGLPKHDAIIKCDWRCCRGQLLGWAPEGGRGHREPLVLLADITMVACPTNIVISIHHAPLATHRWQHQQQMHYPLLNSNSQQLPLNITHSRCLCFVLRCSLAHYVMERPRGSSQHHIHMCTPLFCVIT